MNKTYFIAPLIALIVFTGFYSVHRGGLKEREAAKAAQVEAALKAKNDADLAARKVAMADAIAAAELRKKEKDAKAAKEAADKEARQVAVDARDKASRDQDKTAKQIERIQKEIDAEQAVLAKFAAARKEAEAEKAFLLDFVTKSQANVQVLQTLLTKLNTPAPAPAAVTK
ncbi:MAG: hypothetical protein H7067_10980 [Burkholderiales bacterium]|nr:hypothetical protein [Opitutaceae bacterium]